MVEISAVCYRFHHVHYLVVTVSPVWISLTQTEICILVRWLLLCATGLFSDFDRNVEGEREEDENIAIMMYCGLMCRLPIQAASTDDEPNVARAPVTLAMTRASDTRDPATHV